MLNSLSVKAKMLLLNSLMVVGILILATILILGMNSLVKIGQSNALSIEAQTTLVNMRIDRKGFFQPSRC